MAQQDFTTIMPERDILTGAWFIIKNHAGINTRAAGSDAQPEWDTICQELVELSSKGNTAPQRVLANKVAMAISEYYEAGCR